MERNRTLVVSFVVGLIGAAVVSQWTPQAEAKRPPRSTQTSTPAEQPAASPASGAPASGEPASGAPAPGEKVIVEPTATPEIPAEPPKPDPNALTKLAPTALSAALPLPKEVQAALSSRDHAKAAAGLLLIPASGLTGRQVGDHAFLTAWSLQRAGRTTEALKHRAALEQAESAPPSYVDLLSGELLMAEGDRIGALERLARVDGAIRPRARLAMAEALIKLERTSEAKAIYEELLARPDPASGSAQAMLMMIPRSTPEVAQSYRRRLYRFYPGSAESAAAPLSSPTLEDLSWRGDTLQGKGHWDSTVSLLAPRIAEAKATDATGCRYRYAYGRALHKQNELTASIPVLEPLGRGCQKIEGDSENSYGARALYVAGKSYERKKEWAAAAKAYRQIPELYPDHSMADDGYALGGIALQESGDLAGARALWAAGLEKRPDGDMAAEIAWRLAWGAALAGDTTEAIRVCDLAQQTVKMDDDPTHWLACAYWAGRWRAWPDNTAKIREAGRAEAITRLEAVAKLAPWHWYGLMAASRLAALDPAAASKLKRPDMDLDTDPWQVRTGWLEEPAVRSALGLARVGLLGDALSELGTLDTETFTGSEMAIRTQIEARTGQFLLSHDRMRSWLKNHPPTMLGPNTYRVLRVAYPPAYWDQVQAATKNYAWDGRLFHGLVREESNFNPEIKSHAGACGLSQLMPGTASACAKRMGIPWSSSKVWDVQTNLNIGAWYLNNLHTRYKGNSAISLSAYNAGEGNADRWLSEHPDWPTDAYAESITFRETRFYVKRVSSTWLTYRLVYDSGPLYPDWSTWLYDAVP